MLSLKQKIIKQNFILLIIVLIIGVLAGTSIFNSLNYSFAKTPDEEIEAINSKIADKKKEIEKINTKIKSYKNQITQKRQQAQTLKAQLEILNDQLETTSLEISKMEIKVNQIELEISANEKEITRLKEKESKLKDQIAELIREINKEDDKTYLEIVLLYENLSEFFNHINYLTNVEKGLKTDLDHLKSLSEQLNIEQKNLLTRKNNLVAIKRKLEEEKGKLESQQYAKQSLLQQTHNSERQYQNLISQERALQNKINNEIVNLEHELRKKIAQTDQLGDISKYGMIWPVPSRYITAGFHDPDYPFRNIFEHPAIDIRAAQGTPVRAAASGYVARAKNGGMGYSYVMIMHANGISTVYGHLSKIFAKEDTYVVQGDVIGLSGGMPGTPGAGRFVTGPHLHFEVRLNGVPINPVPYLP